MAPQLRIWGKAWCLPIPTTTDALQLTATRMPQQTPMPMPPLLVPPTHMLHWYRRPRIHTLPYVQAPENTYTHVHVPTDLISVYSVLVLLLSSSYQSSVLGSGFGSLNAPKPAPASDIRTSEQLNGPRLGQRASQTLANTSNSNVSKDAGPPPIQSPAPAPSPSVETKPQRLENGPVTALHCKFTSKVNKDLRTRVHCSTLVVKCFLFSSVEMKLQPEPSAVLSQLAQRQQQSILPTTEPLHLSQSHAPQVPTPPGIRLHHYHFLHFSSITKLPFKADSLHSIPHHTELQLMTIFIIGNTLIPLIAEF